MFVRLIVLLSVGLIALPVAFSHHTQNVYFDVATVAEVEGEVTQVFWRNPHVRFDIRVVDENGDEVTWEMEGRALSVLARMEISSDLIRVGDRVRVAGHPGKIRTNAMFVDNVLLPNGREVLLGPEEQPRWTSETLGSLTALMGGPAGEFTGRGIFRVWSTDYSDRSRRFWHSDYPLTPVAQAARDVWDPIEDNPMARCTPKGMPTIMDQPFPIEFVDQGDNILLRIEEYDVARTIYLDQNSADPDRPGTPMGYSVGQWEGKTLAVRTSNSSWPLFDQTGIPMSGEAVLFEQFIVSADENRLDYRLRVTDPVNFTEPVILERHWIWKPGEEIRPFECVLRGESDNAL